MGQRKYTKDELRAAGRMLRRDAAAELASQSGATEESWDGFLYGAILEQHVERLNPDNLADPLPWGYIGHIVDSDHLSIASVNTYLAKHPERGNARLGVETANTQPGGKRRTWGDKELLELLQEAERGATQVALAAKYDISRQAIGKALTKAHQIHGKRIGPPPGLAQTGRLPTKRRY
jgi:hypothetical protein